MTKEEKLEQKKNEIESKFIQKQWELERLRSDYFENKHRKYIHKNTLSEEDRIEIEYIEMYDLYDLYEEEDEE